MKIGVPSNHITARTCKGYDLQLAVASMVAVSGLAVTCLNLVHCNAYLLTLGPALASAGVLTLVLHRAEPTPRTPTRIPAGRLRGLQACFWLLLGLVALIAHDTATQRPLVFFVLVSLACAVLVTHLSGKATTSNMVLFFAGAILLSLVVRGSVFFLSSGFPGSDAWGHETLTQALLLEGHLPTEWDPPYYLHYPAMHLTVAATATILGVSSKFALFVSVGVPLAFSALAVAVVARRFGGFTSASLAALLTLFTSYHLQWGTQIIPTSMGLSLFTLALAVVLAQPRPTPPRSLLLLLIAIVLVLCHTVSAFILWTALCGLAAAAIVVPTVRHSLRAWFRRDAAALLLVLLTVSMFTHWNLNPYTSSGASFFEQMVVTSRDSLVNEAGFLDRPAEAGTDISQHLLAVAGFATFYCLMALGALQRLGIHRRDQFSLSVVVAAAILSVVAFAFPVFGIRNILPHRWFGFIWVLGAELAASGLLFALSFVRSGSAAVASGAAMVGVLVFLMVTAPVSNTDSPIYARQITQQLVFQESELRAAQWLSDDSTGPYAADLQFGQRVLHDHLDLYSVATTLTEPSSLTARYYLWRVVTLSRPVQVHDGDSVYLGPIHLVAIEADRPIVYSSARASVLAPSTFLSPEGMGDAA